MSSWVRYSRQLRFSIHGRYRAMHALCCERKIYFFFFSLVKQTNKIEIQSFVRPAKCILFTVASRQRVELVQQAYGTHGERKREREKEQREASLFARERPRATSRGLGVLLDAVISVGMSRGRNEAGRRIRITLTFLFTVHRIRPLYKVLSRQSRDYKPGC